MIRRGFDNLAHPLQAVLIVEAEILRLVQLGRA
jgi:hypothetical protein